MQKLAIYVGGYRHCIGLSLRGNCTEPVDAVYLQQALAQTVQQLQTLYLPYLWLDCQRLETLSWQGQRALLRADSQARTAGILPCWCGLPEGVTKQLLDSGVHTFLHLLPVESYQGPLPLLEDYLPRASHITPAAPRH